MRALTVRQPFADLEIAGVKTVENRTKPPTWWRLQPWGWCRACRMRLEPGEWDGADSHTIPEHEPGCRGDCGSCPVPVRCGPVEPDGPYPFRLAIHSAQVEVERSDLWYAAISSHADVEYWRGREGWFGARGAIVGTVQVDGAHHDDECEPVFSCSRWAEEGLWHWELSDPRPLDDPIPAKGQQGLWRLDDDVADQLRAVAA